jgi:hypothetical protein
MKYLFIIALILPLNSFAKESQSETRVKSLTLLTLMCPVCLVPAIINEGSQAKVNIENKNLKPKESIQRNLASEPKKK